MSDNLAKLLFNILKECDVSISYRTVEQVVNTHPEYPSMQCISDAFDSWKVKHVVMKITIEKLIVLNVPVIAHLKRGGFIWITRIRETKVYYCNSAGKEKEGDIDRFEKEWSGVALAIENTDDAGNPDYRKTRRKVMKEDIFRYLMAGGFAIFLVAQLFFSWVREGGFSLLPKLFLFLVNLAGCYISYLLIRQEKHQSNALSEKFCKAGKYIDCNKVTSSNYSNFYGLFTWAELGFAFFSSLALWVAIVRIAGKLLKN